jgi:hypothetical protein
MTGKTRLGNYSEIVFLLLLLLHLVLLAHASLAQSVYTMNSLPASSEGWSLAYAPEQVEDKWGFYAESGPEPIRHHQSVRILERAIIPWRRAIDGLRPPLDTCHERRVRASL